MNDTYLMWLMWKVSDLQVQIDEYVKENEDKPYSGNSILMYLIIRYNIYSECLEKYKEEKNG